MATQKEDQKLVVNTIYRLMQVKSIAEWSILQYFRPSLSCHLSLISMCFFIFLSGRLRQVLLYSYTGGAACMYVFFKDFFIQVKYCSAKLRRLFSTLYLTHMRKFMISLCMHIYLQCSGAKCFYLILSSETNAYKNNKSDINH